MKLKRFHWDPHTTKAFKSISIMALVATSLAACGRGSRAIPDRSQLAEVTVSELPRDDYTRYELQFEARDGNPFSMPKSSFNRGPGKIEAQVPAGRYRILLDYYNGNELVWSADRCRGTDLNNVRDLEVGGNNISINVCDKENKPAPETASVTIKPKVKTGSGQNKPMPPNPPSPPPSGGNAPNSTGTFRISGHQLIDPSGKPFVMRGINTPNAYYKEQSYNALTEIKAMGFNTVRIVWCADTITPDIKRCNPEYHLHSPSDLRRILARMRELKLVAVFNLQNVTGSDKIEHLQAMADYLVKPAVKEVLLEYKDMLLINIANEWFGPWGDRPDYLQGYKLVIPRLRTAGLPHVFIVDAQGYGQDRDSIPRFASDFASLDPNIMLSAHMYEQFGTPELVRGLFAFVRSRKVPFLIGEYGCSHGRAKVQNPDGSTSLGDLQLVPCETIIEEAENPNHKVGTIAWSFTGNDPSLVDLNVVDFGDWKTPTDFGRRVLDNPRGVRRTSKEACFFSPMSCN